MKLKKKMLKLRFSMLILEANSHLHINYYNPGSEVEFLFYRGSRAGPDAPQELREGGPCLLPAGSQQSPGLTSCQPEGSVCVKPVSSADGTNAVSLLYSAERRLGWDRSKETLPRPVNRRSVPSEESVSAGVRRA